MKCSSCKLFNKCRAIRAASRDHFRWTIHNLLAHPISELFWLAGFKELSNKIHDKSIPIHEPEQGRS